jgi:hypothetical protein
LRAREFQKAADLDWWDGIGRACQRWDDGLVLREGGDMREDVLALFEAPRAADRIGLAGKEAARIKGDAAGRVVVRAIDEGASMLHTSQHAQTVRISALSRGNSRAVQCNKSHRPNRRRNPVHKQQRS